MQVRFLASRASVIGIRFTQGLIDENKYAPLNTAGPDHKVDEKLPSHVTTWARNPTSGSAHVFVFTFALSSIFIDDKMR